MKSILFPLLELFFLANLVTPEARLRSEQQRYLTMQVILNLFNMHFWETFSRYNEGCSLHQGSGL